MLIKIIIEGEKMRSQSNSRNNRNRQKNRCFLRGRHYILKTVYFLSLISVGYLSYMILVNKILPNKYRTVSMLFLALIYAVFALLVFKLKPIKQVTNGQKRASAIKRDKKIKIISFFLSFVLLIFGCGSAFANMYVHKGLKTARDISKNENIEKLQFSLIVLKSSPMTKLSDVGSMAVGASLERDKENVDEYVKKLMAEKNTSLNLKNANDYAGMAKSLLENEQKVILFNEGYRAIVEEGVKDFSEKTRIIDSVVIERTKQKTEDTTVKNAEGCYNIYVSGNDNYGTLSNISRSDVNLILSVNTNTKKILITTVPRDSYVRIPGRGNNQFDKLTHAGIYGVETSQKTLENLFGIKIDYYARINFTSLIKIVDVLGGIEVKNDQSFTAGGYHFDKGTIHLNGERALLFARERHALTGGDLDRGRNHTKIIEAMISKAMSPSILLNYNNIMNAVLEATQTNVPKDLMISVINKQLESGGSWKIEKTDISGHGTTGTLPSYAMPGWKLYMFVPDENSIKATKEKMDKILSGQ